MGDLLSPGERGELIDIVSKLYDFRAVDTRVTFLYGVGLGRFVANINLDKASRSVARAVVVRLEDFGELPERPAYHALGALLDAILQLGELNADDSRIVAGLLVRYSLVADEDYLAKLREEHRIDEPAARQPAAEHVVPVARAEKADEGPDFDVGIPDELTHGDDTGEEALEAVLNTVDNFLDIQLLTGAVYCAKAVCRIEYPLGKALGTGFLLGPDLLLTNQHVLKSRDYLGEAKARFGFELDSSGVGTPGTVVGFETDFYHASPADELDYALVRLERAPLAQIAVEDANKNLDLVELARSGKHRGYLLTAPRGSFLAGLRRVNVLQHPDGAPLKVVLTQNYVVRSTDTRVHYVADTMKGSSGSPVFNERWQVVALHHAGRPYPKPEGAAEKDWKDKYRVNEGIQMKAILEDFKAKGLQRYLPRLDS